MITASMTSGEMRRVRNLDETRIYEFQMRKANELKREMRKQNVRQITKTFELATPNADYLIVVGVKHGDVFASGLFIYLKETNEYIPMSRNEGYSEDCFAMSVHFLKRFAERFLKKDLPIAKILQRYIHRLRVQFSSIVMTRQEEWYLLFRKGLYSQNTSKKSISSTTKPL